MKKIMLIAVVALLSFSVNAQDAPELVSKKGEIYLPEAGDWAISFNADGIFEYIGNSFSGDAKNDAPSVSYARNNSFVGKKFITDKTAYRVVANLQFTSNKQTNETDELKNSGFQLAAGLGKEWRRGNTRLQGFYGADALITVTSGKNEQTFTDTDGTFLSSREEKDGLGLGLGVQGFLGAEYFIFPKFAIGAQYTYGVGFNIAGKSEVTTQNGTDAAVTVDGAKNSSFGLGGVGVASINLTLHF